MTTKIKTYKNGACVTFESPRARSDAPHIVMCRAPNGEVHDKTRCDDLHDARDYFDAFCKIAKNL